MDKSWLGLRIATIILALVAGGATALQDLPIQAIARYPEDAGYLSAVVIIILIPMSVLTIIWVSRDPFHHHTHQSIQHKYVSVILAFWSFFVLALGMLAPGAVVMLLIGQEVITASQIAQEASLTEIVSLMTWSAVAGVAFDIMEVYWPDFVDVEKTTLVGKNFVFASRIYGAFIMFSAIKAVWGIFPSRHASSHDAVKA